MRDGLCRSSVHHAILKRRLYLLTPVVDGGVVGDDECVLAARHTAGQYGGKGLTSSYPRPITHTLLGEYFPCTPTLHHERACGLALYCGVGPLIGDGEVLNTLELCIKLGAYKL